MVEQLVSNLTDYIDSVVMLIKTYILYIHLTEVTYPLAGYKKNVLAPFQCQN